MFELDQTKTVFHGSDAAIRWGEKAISTGVLITFDLPAPATRPIAHGELHFKRSPSIGFHSNIVSSIFIQPNVGGKNFLDQNMIGNLRLRAPQLPIFKVHEAEEVENLDPLLSRLATRQRKLFFRQHALYKATTAAPVLNSVVTRDDTIVKENAHTLKPEEPRTITETARAISVFDTTAGADRQNQIEILEKILGGRVGLETFLNGYIEQKIRAGQDRHVRKASKSRRSHGTEESQNQSHEMTYDKG